MIEVGKFMKKYLLLLLFFITNLISSENINLVVLHVTNGFIDDWRTKVEGVDKYGYYHVIEYNKVFFNKNNENEFFNDKNKLEKLSNVYQTYCNNFIDNELKYKCKNYGSTSEEQIKVLKIILDQLNPNYTFLYLAFYKGNFYIVDFNDNLISKNLNSSVIDNNEVLSDIRYSNTNITYRKYNREILSRKSSSEFINLFEEIFFNEFNKNIFPLIFKTFIEDENFKTNYSLQSQVISNFLIKNKQQLDSLINEKNRNFFQNAALEHLFFYGSDFLSKDKDISKIYLIETINSIEKTNFLENNNDKFNINDIVKLLLTEKETLQEYEVLVHNRRGYYHSCDNGNLTNCIKETRKESIKTLVLKYDLDEDFKNFIFSNPKLEKNCENAEIALKTNQKDFVLWAKSFIKHKCSSLYNNYEN